MYLIITDHTAKTVRVEEKTFQEFKELWKGNYPEGARFTGSSSKAEQVAREIAIRDNLVYTPGNEL